MIQISYGDDADYAVSILKEAILNRFLGRA